MITLIRKNNNTINKFCVNINQYNEAMDKLTSYKLECGCGIKGNCIKYGKYKRTLIINDKKETIYLQRIYCKHCKKTHTIMPIFIVPYERKPLDYILDLVKGYNDKDISSCVKSLSSLNSLILIFIVSSLFEKILSYEN